MASGPAKKHGGKDTKCADPVPTLKAGREVGWIFKDGEAVAIERRESEKHANEETN